MKFSKWVRACWHDARVNDEDGRLVARFATEAQADEAIRTHNAAPAMLAALNAAYNVLTNASKTPHEKFCEATTLLENAIDRAEGR